MTQDEYSEKYEKLQGNIDYINRNYEDLLSLDDDYIYSLEQHIIELEVQLADANSYFDGIHTELLAKKIKES